MKKLFSVDQANSDTRLDRWFKRFICDVPQSLIEKSIRRGKIKINDKKVKSSYKLKINDKIIIYDLNILPDKNKKKTTIYIPTKKDLKHSSKIFIENNENFVVINKPAGIAVQSGTKSNKNILDILKKTDEFKSSVPFTVHRIDKETTGILIVAKNRQYAQLLTSLFRLRKIHKTYLGIALGEFEKEKGTFTDKLFNYEGKKKVYTQAITHFSVMDSNSNYTLIKLHPITGRKHQLRKQLLLNGHPILGDSKYRVISKHTDKKYADKKKPMMLHAYQLIFSILVLKNIQNRFY